MQQHLPDLLSSKCDNIHDYFMSLWRGNVQNLRKGLGSSGRTRISCKGRCKVLDLWAGPGTQVRTGVSFLILSTVVLGLGYGQGS